MAAARLFQQLEPHVLHVPKTPSAFKLEEISYTPPKTEKPPEPRSKYEVPPEDWVPPDTFPENRFPNGQLKPHGQKMKCDKGIDFAQTCPIGWTYVPKGLNGPECKAPPNFYTETNWCRQQLTQRQAIPASIDERSGNESRSEPVQQALEHLELSEHNCLSKFVLV
ncbi:unnamed protein product [Durusdinium trenchii]|uniref:Uncharacterized protein n=1 Tax=Durusdinium trenchii TaxID=1381693 RepID=A0ABP0S354_9DINO